MSQIDDLLTVGYDDGEMDFGVRGTVADLTYEQMNELRIMTIVAIGVMEDMWHRAQERKDIPHTDSPTNQSSEEK